MKKQKRSPRRITQDTEGTAHRHGAETPEPDRASVLDTRHIKKTPLGSELADINAAHARRGIHPSPTTDLIATPDAGEITSDNLGGTGSLDKQGNVDTRATGPAGTPSIGNLDPAGTGNAGTAGLGSSGTALDAALNTNPAANIGTPVTESLSTPGVGSLNAAGTAAGGEAGISEGGVSDAQSVGSSGVGTADAGKSSGSKS